MLRFAAVAVPAAAVFLAISLVNLRSPGVYFDAVMPEFLIVNLLHPGNAASASIGGYPPGNMLWGMVPVLGQIYHGALTLYVTLLPYAVLGTGVLGIRLANIWLGLIVIAACAVFLVSFRVRLVFAVAGLVLLASDPGFVFVFRTQFYTTLFPIALVLLSAALADSARRPGSRPGLRSGGAGLLAGIACYGYFIYVFVLPALAACALVRAAPGGRLRCCVWWCAGVALGLSPYALGYALIAADRGGIANGLDTLRATAASLGLQQGMAMALADRFALAGTMLQRTVYGIGPQAMMLREFVDPFMPGWKAGVLVAVPVAGLLTAVWRRMRDGAGLVVLAGLAAGYLLLVLAFADRLWLHHAVWMLPVLYLAAVMALDRLASLVPRRLRGVAAIIALAALLPVLAANALAGQRIMGRLAETGGIGLYSDALDHFAQERGGDPSPATMFFPDWGIAAGFVMITRGTVPYYSTFDPAVTRATLCLGRDAVLATLADQPPERLRGWIEAVPWPAPEQATYRQRDGTPVLIATRWRTAERSDSACSVAGATSR